MRIFGAAVAVAWLVAIGLPAGPAHAQTPSVNLLADQPSKTPEQLEKEEAAQKAYKESLKKIPDAKVSNDPWGTVRDTSKDASRDTSKATPAKPKTKTGATQPKTEAR
jgi:hypothetical protein